MIAAAATLALLLLPAQAPPRPAAIAHSHNDYERGRPLEEALERGFGSVEADVWWRWGQVVVSHGALGERGTLEELYLEPLQALVDRRGSVHGDGEPFLLWIDLKDRAPELVEGLRRLLARFPMLAPCRGGGAVQVVLTGREESKRALLEGEEPVPACRDSNRLAPGDPPADGTWTWYALRWGDRFRWDGRGELDPEERASLHALVRAAHATGRRLRLYHAPDTAGFWAEALAAGVDLLGTDAPGALGAFLAGRVAGDGGRVALGP